MGANLNTTVILHRYLAEPPESIIIPPNTNQEILSEFVDSTMSALEKLEGTILAFESGQITPDDFAATTRRILHNIKGEAGIMDFTEISNVCHHAESLLYNDSLENVPVDMLLSIKDWLWGTMQYLKRDDLTVGHVDYP